MSKNKGRLVRPIIAAAITAVAVGITACEVPEDDRTTHAEEVVKEQGAAPAKDKAKPKLATENETPDYTTAQENAIASAVDYLDFQAFSRAGLIDQLSSKYGEGFSNADAVFAINHIDVDWYEQAAAAAKDYLDFDSFSRQGLIDQLESEYGEAFTHAQAVYGVNQTGL
jgi:Host cell surface-exposed lipoprotein